MKYGRQELHPLMNYHCSVLYNIQFLLNWEGTEKEVEEEKEETYIQIGRLVKGKVWMHYNEVLTDEDEMAGFALTCTGHPASNGVIIEFAH